MMVPRVRGKVGKGNSPPEMAGKWFFAIWLDELGAGSAEEPLGQYGPYDTEAEAKEAMRAACRVVCEKLETVVMGKTSGKFVNMLTNEVESWDKE